jgi:drug/metabolite transporter (DMT)-like permease
MLEQHIFVLQWIGLAGALLVGIILLVFQPYKAFLYAVFISLALSMKTASFTRTEELGAFFNLYDACFLIAIMAFLFDRRRTLSIPKPILAFCGVLLLGFVCSWAQYGMNYYLIRNLRWCITLPLAFLLAHNLVRGDDRIKSFLWTLLLAAVVAEIQHMFFVVLARSAVIDATSRTIAFGMAYSFVWLLSGPFVVAGRIPRPRMQIAIAVLFLIATISGETRSIVIGYVGGLVVYYFWLIKGPNGFRWQRFKMLSYIFIIGGLMTVVVGFSDMATSFMDRLVATTTAKTALKAGTQSRELTLEIEMNDWLKGNILIGRGMNYYYSLYGAGKKGTGSDVAWGHLGYVTYLSQYGIIGFLIFGLYFPGAMVFRARRIIRLPDIPPATLYLALLAGACFIIQPLIFLFSGSFLGIASFWPGLVGGALYGIPVTDLEKTAHLKAAIPAVEAPLAAPLPKPSWNASFPIDARFKP